MSVLKGLVLATAGKNDRMGQKIMATATATVISDQIGVVRLAQIAAVEIPARVDFLVAEVFQAVHRIVVNQIDEALLTETIAESVTVTMIIVSHAVTAVLVAK